MVAGAGVTFKRKVYTPAPAAPLQPLDRPVVYADAGGMNAAVAKRPAFRNANLRDLARGEECSVKLGGACRCQPETTVWAHTNTLADNKGMGYKASDERGFFAGYECHAQIDQGRMDSEKLAAVVAAAQARTRVRLRELADSYAAPEWKQKAALWALTKLERL